jgi:hypothetical protein
MGETSDEMRPVTEFAEVGRHRHWFNDLDGRLEAARLAGWEPVLDVRGWHVRRMVGQYGGPVWAYLCEADEAIWREMLPKPRLG